MWEATLHAKEKEAKLQETAKQEDASLTPEQQMKKFTSDVANFVAKHKKSHKWFLCKFYGALSSVILLDIFYLALVLFNEDKDVKEAARILFWVFLGLIMLFVTCLMCTTFNGLRKILKANPQIAVSKWQIGFNLFTVFAMFISNFIALDYLPNLIQILAVLFQLNILWFCWNLVTIPKNGGG